jgi:two-component system CheB/CheR fusion protein
MATSSGCTLRRSPLETGLRARFLFPSRRRNSPGSSHDTSSEISIGASSKARQCEPDSREFLSNCWCRRIAGGLEAVSELLRSIPEKTGLAFVFVQHLDPSHRSNLSEILSRITHIPVEEARDGTVVEPDHAYVIPPNKGLYIEIGVLHLTPRQPREVPNLPVDQFLYSLAADRHHRSIGVILSGTASDGVEGCKVIKEAGGITFAQTEASAKYPGMPQSAVDAGCVDFVLSPKEIAEKLVQIGAHPLCLIMM